MRTKIATIMAGIILGILAGACSSTSNKQPMERQTKHTFIRTKDRADRMDYLLYLPANYARKNRTFPLILFLHGAGERGNDLELVKMHGPPKLAETRDFPFIIVSPQCPSDQWWDIEILHDLLEEVIDQYRVNPRQVYLTGLSMGGYGTWALAAAHPETFAAIAPICGGGDTLAVRQLVNIPVWNFHGAQDPVVPIQRSHEMVQALKNAGGMVKFTIYPEATHDSWTETYDKEELYDWFLEHSKKKTK